MRTDHRHATRVLLTLLALGVVGQTVVHLVNGAVPAGVLGALLLFLAVDEYVVLRERIGVLVSGLLGPSDDWDSVVWPLVYLPLLGAVVLLLLHAARRAAAVPRRLVTLGVACLGAAVLLEIASAPFSTAETAAGVVHALEGAVEEAAELSGWGSVAIGLLSWRRPG